MNTEPDSRGRRWSGGVLVLAAIGALALVAALAFVAITIAALKFFPSSADMRGREHRYLEHQSFSTALAEVKLNSPIDSEMASVAIDKLLEASKDRRIKGIIVEVNSPGGSVVASQEIYDTIKLIKEKIPVVAYMREVAASGAYYATVSSSWLIASRGSMVGSIGVIMSSFEATQLIEWLKIKPVTLKTGQLKDTGSPARPWTAEDKAYLQKLINDTRDQFVSDVRTARPKISPESLKHMSDGRVVLGTEAFERRLVDALGGRSTAIAKAAELAGLSTGADTEVVPMEDPEFRGFLSEILSGSMSSTLTQLLTQLSGHRQTTTLPQLSSPRLNLNSSEMTPSP